jgi:hypothetical protein
MTIASSALQSARTCRSGAPERHDKTVMTGSHYPAHAVLEHADIGMGVFSPA